MTFLHNMLEKRSADSDLARFISRGLTNSRHRVTGYDTLRHSAVWACVNLIADAASTLPVDVYEKRGYYRVPIEVPSIISNPSSEVSPTGWRRQILVSWLLEGNAYGVVVARDNRLNPLQIEILDPFAVTHSYDKETGQKKYSINGNEIDARNIVHYPGLLFPGSNIGVSPITYSSGPISTGLSAQEFGEDYFRRGTKANGILAFQGRLTPEAAELAKQKFISSAQTSHEPVVLSGDVKYTPLQISAQDSQFLETQKSTIQDIARMFRVTTKKIGSESGSSLTYSTVEGNSRAFLQDTLNPWLVRLEEVHDSLLTKPAYAKCNRNAALAIDISARYNAHQMAIRTGFMSVNEARAIEDLPPVDGGDDTLWPPYAFGQVGQDSPLGQ